MYLQVVECLNVINIMEKRINLYLYVLIVEIMILMKQFFIKDDDEPKMANARLMDIHFKWQG